VKRNNVGQTERPRRGQGHLNLSSGARFELRAMSLQLWLGPVLFAVAGLTDSRWARTPVLVFAGMILLLRICFRMVSVTELSDTLVTVAAGPVVSSRRVDELTILRWYARPNGERWLFIAPSRPWQTGLWFTADDAEQTLQSAVLEGGGRVIGARLQGRDVTTHLSRAFDSAAGEADEFFKRDAQ
jgi:hypothetical protein